MKASKLLPRLLLALIAASLDVHAAPPPADSQVDPKDTWHMKRDVGLAWLKLPLMTPAKK